MEALTLTKTQLEAYQNGCTHFIVADKNMQEGEERALFTGRGRSRKDQRATVLIRSIKPIHLSKKEHSTRIKVGQVPLSILGKKRLYSLLAEDEQSFWSNQLPSKKASSKGLDLDAFLIEVEPSTPQ